MTIHECEWVETTERETRRGRKLANGRQGPEVIFEVDRCGVRGCRQKRLVRQGTRGKVPPSWLKRDVEVRIRRRGRKPNAAWSEKSPEELMAAGTEMAHEKPQSRLVTTEGNGVVISRGQMTYDSVVVR